MRCTLAGLLALASCRAFPAGMFVPDSVLDALESSRLLEELDEGRLACTLSERAGQPLALVPEEYGTYWRLDGPELGPLAPAAFEQPGAATAGLMSGDLVLVKNPKAQSLATTLAFAAFTFYDHLGVLVEREGSWFVVDSWPRFHPLVKARDFADRFRGGVRATPLARFLAHYETLRIVRLSDSAANARLASATLESLAEGIEFDPHHDPADPRLSCSEYVELLLARSGQPVTLAPHALTDDAELRGALVALGFPARGFLAPDQFGTLPGATTVGWISRHRSRAGACALEVAFALLHERFRAGGRLGDFLAPDRLHLMRYRTNVALFLRWAEAWGEARGLERRELMESELRELLPLFFVPRA